MKITLLDGVFDLTVGDTVYVVLGHRGDIDAPITKIGKKYFYVKFGYPDLKFEISTGMEYHGANSCGERSRCYSSKEAVDEIKLLHEKVRHILVKVEKLDRYDIALSKDKINAIYELLFKE